MRILLSFGDELIFVIFDFTRVPLGQKHSERIEVDNNGKQGSFLIQRDPFAIPSCFFRNDSYDDLASVAGLF